MKNIVWLKRILFLVILMSLTVCIGCSLTGNEDDTDTIIPFTPEEPVTVQYGKYLFLVGGENEEGEYQYTILKSTTDGSVVGEEELQTPNSYSFPLIAGNYLYLLGGEDENGPVDSIYYTLINTETGALGFTSGWARNPRSLPEPINNAKGAVQDGRIYLYEETAGKALPDIIYTSRIYRDGQVGLFIKADAFMPEEISSFQEKISSDSVETTSAGGVVLRVPEFIPGSGFVRTDARHPLRITMEPFPGTTVRYRILDDHEEVTALDTGDTMYTQSIRIEEDAVIAFQAFDANGDSSDLQIREYKLLPALSWVLISGTLVPETDAEFQEYSFSRIDTTEGEVPENRIWLNLVVPDTAGYKPISLELNMELDSSNSYTLSLFEVDYETAVPDKEGVPLFAITQPSGELMRRVLSLQPGTYRVSVELVTREMTAETDDFPSFTIRVLL